MSSRKLLFVRSFALSLFMALALPARADLLPHYTIQEMCMRAGAVIAGEYRGEGKVQVTEVLMNHDLLIAKDGMIEVPSIKNHGRKCFQLKAHRLDGEEIATRKLVLFLKEDKFGAYVPMDFIGQGSQGLIWYNDKRCYRYQQFDVPGGYLLMGSGKDVENIPAGKEELWEDVQAGLRSRELLNDIKAIREPERRARAMAMFYLKDNAIEDHFDPIYFHREFMEIGVVAIPEIADILKKVGPDERTDELSDILINLTFKIPHPQKKKDLQPVVEPLMKWLETCKTSDPCSAMRVLSMARDAKAIPVVRPFLQSEHQHVHRMAAITLAALNDRESFDAIAKLLEDSEVEGVDTYNLGLAIALYSMDPKRAAPIIEKASQRPHMKGLSQQVPGFNP